MAEKKKKKSIYSKKLKDINKDGKRNFKDTFLGDLLGADGKAGIKKGRPGLKASLKGARREDGKADPTAKRVQKVKKKVTKSGSSGRTMDSVVNELRSQRKVTPAKPKPTRKDMTSVVDKAARDRNASERAKAYVPMDTRVNDSKKIGGIMPGAKVTYKQWQGLTKTQRRKLGLPESVLGAQREFKRFKTGVTGKDYTVTSEMSKGGMAKKKAGYSKGGMTKRSGYSSGGSVSKVTRANCGASMKPSRGARK